MRLTVLIALVLLAPFARAEDKNAARAAYAEGRRHYDLNEFTPALEAFKRAYVAFEDPVFLFNIAQCHRQLGHREDAIKFYRSYLRNQPDAANRDEVNATIAKLESEIADQKQRETQAAAAAKAAAPPPMTTAATPVPPTASTTLVATPSPAPQHTPVYRKWWLWTIVGVVAAGAATGIAIGVTSQRTESTLMPLTVSR
jgi:hypothetical protein